MVTVRDSNRIHADQVGCAGTRLPAGNDFEITSWIGSRNDELVMRQLGVSPEEPPDTQNQYPSASARQPASDGDMSEDLSDFEEKTVQEDEGTLLWLGKGLLWFIVEILS